MPLHDEYTHTNIQWFYVVFYQYSANKMKYIILLIFYESKIYNIVHLFDYLIFDNFHSYYCQDRNNFFLGIVTRFT